jgi:hypothetical protein
MPQLPYLAEAVEVYVPYTSGLPATFPVPSNDFPKIVLAVFNLIALIS